MGISVKSLLKHLRDRQVTLSSGAFNFHHVLRNNNLETAEYPKEAQKVLEGKDSGANIDNPQDREELPGTPKKGSTTKSPGKKSKVAPKGKTPRKGKRADHLDSPATGCEGVGLPSGTPSMRDPLPPTVTTPVPIKALVPSSAGTTVPFIFGGPPVLGEIAMPSGSPPPRQPPFTAMTPLPAMTSFPTPAATPVPPGIEVPSIAVEVPRLPLAANVPLPHLVPLSLPAPVDVPTGSACYPFPPYCLPLHAQYMAMLQHQAAQMTPPGPGGNCGIWPGSLPADVSVSVIDPQLLPPGQPTFATQVPTLQPNIRWEPPSTITNAVGTKQLPAKVLPSDTSSVQGKIKRTPKRKRSESAAQLDFTPSRSGRKRMPTQKYLDMLT
jgi:hypothetical protein